MKSLFLQYKNGLNAVVSKKTGYRESYLSNGSLKDYSSMQTVEVVSSYLGVSVFEFINFLSYDLDYPAYLLPEEIELDL